MAAAGSPRTRAQAGWGQQLPHIPAPSLTICRPWQRPPCWTATATAPPPSPPTTAFCAAGQRCPNSSGPSLSQLILPACVTRDKAGTPASEVQTPPSTHPAASSRHAGCLAGRFPSGVGVGGCGSPREGVTSTPVVAHPSSLACLSSAFPPRLRFPCGTVPILPGHVIFPLHWLPLAQTRRVPARVRVPCSCICWPCQLCALGLVVPYILLSRHLG